MSTVTTSWPAHNKRHYSKPMFHVVTAPWMPFWKPLVRPWRHILTQQLFLYSTMYFVWPMLQQSATLLGRDNGVFVNQHGQVSSGTNRSAFYIDLWRLIHKLDLHNLWDWSVFFFHFKNCILRSSHTNLNIYEVLSSLGLGLGFGCSKWRYYL